VSALLRRLAVLTLLAVLAGATSASAALRPIRRDHGETVLPRLRAGTIRIPTQRAHGQVRVIVRLGLPPLAAWNAQRSVASAGATQHLDVASRSAQAYLARVDAAQRVAIAQLRAAIPEAQVGERYRVVLDGFAVRVPVQKLPTLARLGLVTKLYPSTTFSTTMDRGPSVISADVLQAATGDRGDGVKIGVVDTGVDWRSPFLSPEGYSYPAGFPKGDKTKTTPKVIVARNFSPALNDNAGRKAFDPTEPHGTHVSGIAAGDAGTTAPAGVDHPATANLSGVAPRAYIGNYRVFNVPTPLGHVANTPEIVAAFEQAVVDGMDVINFSGGGAETDPANDAMIETVRNVALAGVVPVVAAGNDRDDFGLGSAGSPGTAPAAIAVAAVSNRHVFAPVLTILGGPPALQAIPIQGSGGAKLPAAWGTLDQTLVDVTSIVGTDGKPVEGHLCAAGANPNAASTTLPAHSLDGAIALALRGTCTFASKADRVRRAGAIGLVLIDNRFGEANGIPIRLGVRAGMISDLDGQRVRAYLAGVGGRTKIRVSTDIREIQTDRSGIVTSFSSGGPTDFNHDLKPDISAPGLEVLSSTPPKTTGQTFSVFAGTSMATPHVAGAAALLVARHPAWTTAQVKSALMSTAGVAWGDTARTQEAPVWLEGAGLANVAAADDPHLFTDPQSLSFRRIDVSTGAQRASQLLTVTDAGNGGGTWTASVQPQAQTTGVTVEVPGTFDLGPGGDVSVPIVVRAAADAALGANYGFVVLRNGDVQRRVPYAFEIERPALRDAPTVPLRKLQAGDTRNGTNRVSVYCCPQQPFGPPPTYIGQPMNQDGAEQLYVTEIDQPVANFGVSVLVSSPGALIDPFVLGSKNENDVQGYAGTPTDVNDLTYDAHVDVGAAGAQFPRLKRFYVSVDSRADPFTGGSLKGQYLLNAWVNDVTPPSVRMLTTRVSAGRPLLVAQAVDLGSGVDPLSLVIAYKRILLGASAYDPSTGIIVFGVPSDAPRLPAGRTPAVLSGSDYQETKNINTPADTVYPNTAFRRVRLNAVNGPALTWVLPFARDCVAPARERLVVTAGSTTKVVKVVFRVDGRRVGVDRTNAGGVFAIDWKTAGVKKGRHELLATVFDRSSRSDSAGRKVSVCAKR
jgi:minor extracellular serine protease Vpr